MYGYDYNGGGALWIILIIFIVLFLFTPGFGGRNCGCQNSCL